MQNTDPARIKNGSDFHNNPIWPLSLVNAAFGLSQQQVTGNGRQDAHNSHLPVEILGICSSPCDSSANRFKSLRCKTKRWRALWLSKEWQERRGADRHSFLSLKLKLEAKSWCNRTPRPGGADRLPAGPRAEIHLFLKPASSSGKERFAPSAQDPAPVRQSSFRCEPSRPR